VAAVTAPSPVPFPAPTWRTAPAAAAAVIIATEHGDRLLMVRQRRRSAIRWEVPGGSQEPGETLEVTAARELLEEAGVVAAVGGLLASYVVLRPAEQVVMFGGIYRADPVDLTQEPKPQLDDDILEAGYVDPLGLPAAELGPVTRRFVQHWWPSRSVDGPPLHIRLERTAADYVEI
jgi:8-oxo-dGTP pyrophosphatase MutT (NUDIX family)